MRPGRVVNIRVNPKDCMSVLDVARLTGTPTAHASFSMLVSLALASLLQTARKQGLVPDRDGFEFTEMMAPFEAGQNRRRQLEFADTIHRLGSEIQAPALRQPMYHETRQFNDNVEVSIQRAQEKTLAERLAAWDPEGDVPLNKIIPHTQWTPEQREAEMRRQDLEIERETGKKMPAAPTLTPEQKEVFRDLQTLIDKKRASHTNPEIYWGLPDEVEMQRLHKLVFPEDFGGKITNTG